MKKKILSIMAAILLVSALCIPVSAEIATDYTYAETEAFDFCVFNIWGNVETGVDPIVPTIEKITMTITVSDFSGEPVEAKLYSREQVTWKTWATEAQTISGDGTYTFELEMGENAFPAESLATIYIKDVRCTIPPDEDPDGESLKASGVTCRVVLDSVEFNKASSSGSEETTAANGENNNGSASSGNTPTAGNSASPVEDSGKIWNPSALQIGIAAGAAVIVIAVVVAVVIVQKKKKK